MAVVERYPGSPSGLYSSWLNDLLEWSRWAEGRDARSGTGGYFGRWLLAAGWVAVAAPFVVDAVHLARADHLGLVHSVPDDAAYYLGVASNAAHGQGFTFDGIHATNGFHPLWQVLLIPLARFLSGEELLRVALYCSSSV